MPICDNFATICWEMEEAFDDALIFQQTAQNKVNAITEALELANKELCEANAKFEEAFINMRDARNKYYDINDITPEQVPE